ncbi:uncharacterized protein VTP21DRAFT_10653 [Calcarisporiella thermophila]|uniref:uncharacterized protein n=1 Tax=Calcarisporiella thermophila TaxID=911321 RepID=UPI0037449BE4
MGEMRAHYLAVYLHSTKSVPLCKYTEGACPASKAALPLPPRAFLAPAPTLASLPNPSSPLHACLIVLPTRHQHDAHIKLKEITLISDVPNVAQLLKVDHRILPYGEEALKCRVSQMMTTG